MKYCFSFIISFLTFCSPVKADEQVDFLSHFIMGKYHLIGKVLDSNKPYYGRVFIEVDSSKISVKRVIDGVAIEGAGSIEKVLAGEAYVLRVRFAENGVKFEKTCMVNSDLDNYARMTCYLYKPGVKTTQPGLEALFIVHE